MALPALGPMATLRPSLLHETHGIVRYRDLIEGTNLVLDVLFSICNCFTHSDFSSCRERVWE